MTSFDYAIVGLLLGFYLGYGIRLSKITFSFMNKAIRFNHKWLIRCCKLMVENNKLKKMNKNQYCGEGCPGRDICGLEECLNLGLATPLNEDQLWYAVWKAVRKETLGRNIPDECIEDLKKKYHITRKPVN